jgi:sulfoxide reductase heme-binding subunit YedZ
MTRAAPANYVWWLAGRSAGMVAMLLVACSVVLGLAMAARAIPSRWRGDAVRLHQHLALISLGAIAAHGLLLAADPWLKAGAKGIAVPFAMGYRPLWTGLGILGGYLAAVLSLSFYVRRKIGGRLWRRMHRLTVLVYLLALTHALGSGTDASIPVVRYAMLASALPVLFLFALRLQRSRGRDRPRRREAHRAIHPEQAGPPGRAKVRAVASSSARTAGRHAVELHIGALGGRLEPPPSQRS